MANKIKILVFFEGEFGNEEIEPVTVEAEVSNYKGFDNFRQGFDIYERAVLKARKDTIEQATERYMEEMSKKKAMVRMSKLGEK